MASVQNKSLAELESMKQNLIAEGKTLSTSKELGKVENAIKVLRPENYGREAVASATEQLRMSTEPLTQQQLGIAPIPSTAGGRAGTTGTSPAGTLDLNAMYETAMGGEIADIEKQITDKQSALTQAMANINDNPYYSEATRTGQLAKLQDRANTEIQTLQNQLTMKKADLQTQLNIATQQYNIQSQEYQNNLNRLNLLISTGAIAGASAEDIAQISEATGMGTSMVQSIISKVNEGNRNLQTSTDNAGNVTIFDANTGAIVNRISGIGKASTSGGADSMTESERQRNLISNTNMAFNSVNKEGNPILGSDGKSSPESYKAIRQSFIAQGGGTAEDFDALFFGYANLDVDPDRYGISAKVLDNL